MTNTRFTASNGLYVENGQVYLPDGTRANVSSVRAVALIEYGAHKAQAERDAALGRLRSVEHPDYFAVGEGNDSVRVCDESMIRVWGFSREIAMKEPNAYSGTGSEAACSVAREYFAAHPVPEPKPWEQATPGEVWVLTFPDGTSEAYKVYPGGTLITCWESNRLKSLTRDGSDAIAGRRIWPEVSE